MTVHAEGASIESRVEKLRSLQVPMSNTAASLAVSLVSLVRCIKCFRTRPADVWFSSSVDDVVLSAAVHPNLLFGYRLTAFLFALLVSVLHLKMKGFKPLRFYTKWNFYALTLYFGLTVWETMWFRRRKSRDREHPFGPGSYLAIILYHLNMTTVWAVDLGTWAILYPLARGDPEVIATFFFNAFSYIEHCLNLLMMIVECSLNRMPFFDHLRGSVGVWYGMYVVWLFMHHVHTGNWIYPVLNTAYMWSPLVYCFTFFGHLCAFRLFAYLHWAKTQIIIPGYQKIVDKIQ